MPDRGPLGLATVTETDKEMFTTNFNPVDDMPFPIEDMNGDDVNPFPSLAEAQLDLEQANQRFLQLLSDHRQTSNISFKYFTVKTDTRSPRRPASTTYPVRPISSSASSRCCTWL